MDRSQTRDALLPDLSAPQHERIGHRAPRPLPLFLELVRQVSARDPEIARDALKGLKAYELAPRQPLAPSKPEIARVGSATLRGYYGEGPVAVLIPSLINSPRILDLDPEVSLAEAIARIGRRVVLLDWGEAEQRSNLSASWHVEALLLPLLRELGEPASLIGYCLGGTMAIAAANLIECKQVVTLAAPWNFSCYPTEARLAVRSMWEHAQDAAQALNALPMEVLQAAFWSLDPERTVHKFAQFGRLAADSSQARRFIALEDWANDGEPLPCPAARELIEDFFGHDLPGSGKWKVGGKTVTDKIVVPLVNLLAENDRIAPAATAPAGEAVMIPAGHVGMVVGSARRQLQSELARVLSPACR